MTEHITHLSPEHLQLLSADHPLRWHRKLSAEEWIETIGSGTLRRNMRLGFSWRSHYLSERVPFEFGWEWEILPSTRITLGPPMTEGDCRPVTEAGWHIDRYQRLFPFPEDVFEGRFIQVEYEDGTKKEGIGIVCLQTSARVWRKGNTIFCIIAEFDTENKCWKEADNPF